MNTNVHRLTVASVALAAFVLAAVAPVSWAGGIIGFAAPGEWFGKAWPLT